MIVTAIGGKKSLKTAPMLLPNEIEQLNIIAKLKSIIGDSAYLGCLKL